LLSDVYKADAADFVVMYFGEPLRIILIPDSHGVDV
jgi:hypothetical protein